MADQRSEGTRLRSSMQPTTRRPSFGVAATRVSDMPKLGGTRRISRTSATRHVSIPAHLRSLRAGVPLRLAIAENRAVRTTRVQRQWLLLSLPLVASLVLLADALLRNRSFLRADALDRLPRLLPAALGALAITAAATWLATDSAAALRRAASLRCSALLAGPLSLLPLIIVLGDETHAGERAHDLNRWGLPCFFLAYLIASASLIVLKMDLRRRRSLLVTWQGVALASAAASWSALALLMHCPGAEPQHLVVGHVLPICALPLLGLLLARRALRLL